MPEKTIYQDRAVTITNRKFISEQGEYPLVEFFALDIKQLEFSMSEFFFRGFAYGLPLVFLNILLFALIDNTLFESILVGITLGYWMLFAGEKVLPYYAIYADTRRGEKLILKGYGKRYTEKIARIIAAASGCVPAPKKIIY